MVAVMIPRSVRPYQGNPSRGAADAAALTGPPVRGVLGVLAPRETGSPCFTKGNALAKNDAASS